MKASVNINNVKFEENRDSAIYIGKKEDKVKKDQRERTCRCMKKFDEVLEYFENKKEESEGETKEIQKDSKRRF